ncbi:hypothetical protein CHH80_12165 [Bacillus sp. 7504-2]|nr:hypothetical protein CHH80_12165 [Bacillus sp. 7504-2]
MGQTQHKLITAFVVSSLAVSTISPMQGLASNFTDVSDLHWAKKAIDYMKEKGIVRGYTDGTYKPEAYITRGELAVMLANSLQLNMDGIEKQSFIDIPENSFAFLHVAALQKHFPHIFKGNGGYFHPNQVIDRQTLAHLIAKTYEVEMNRENQMIFTDVDDSHPYSEDIHILASNGIVVGDGNGRFKPRNPVTRAQAAQFIYNVHHYEGPEKIERIKAISNTSVEITYKTDVDIEKLNFLITDLQIVHIEKTDNHTVVLTTSSQTEGKKYVLKESGRIIGDFIGYPKKEEKPPSHGGGSTPLTPQQQVDAAIRNAVARGNDFVVVKARGGGDITVTTDSKMDIYVEVDTVRDLTIKGSNIENVKIRKVGSEQGLITGDLVVDTPKADVEYENPVKLLGTLYIKDVSGNSFVNYGELNDVDISDSNISHFVNHGRMGILTISNNGNITIDGSSLIDLVNVQDAAEVSIPNNAKVKKVVVMHRNAKVSAHSEVEVVYAYEVKPIENVRFNDLDPGVDIKGEIIFTATEAIHSGANSLQIDVNNIHVKSIPLKGLEDEEITYSMADIDLQEDDTITLSTINEYGVVSAPIEVKVVNNIRGKSPALTGKLLNGQLFEVTFEEQRDWRESITSIVNETNGSSIPLSYVDTSNPGIIIMDLSKVDFTPGNHTIRVDAEGYEPAKFIIEILEPVLIPPNLTGEVLSPQQFQASFADAPNWRESITDVWDIANERWIGKTKLTTTEVGKLILNVEGRIYQPGTYEFLIKAEGYEDAVLTVNVPKPKDAPEVRGYVTGINQFVIEFEDDPAWREKVRYVYNETKKQTIYMGEVDTSQEGKITIKQTGYVYETGVHIFRIEAAGYEPVRIAIEKPESFTPPTLTGEAIGPELFQATFSDDPKWRESIVDVWDITNEEWLGKSKLTTTEEGKLILNVEGKSYGPGRHGFSVDASGYERAVFFVEIPEYDLPPNVVSAYVTESNEIVFEFYDNPDWRNSITQVYDNTNGQYFLRTKLDVSQPGRVILKLGSTSLSGKVSFFLQAPGYDNVSVEVEIPEPEIPEPKSPELTVEIVEPNIFDFIFPDNAEWRNNITNVYNETTGTPIHLSEVDRSIPGKLRINLKSYYYVPGTYALSFHATGYPPAMVLLEVPMPPQPPVLTGEVIGVNIFQATFVDDPKWRESITDIWDMTHKRWLGKYKLNTIEAGKIILDVEGRDYPPGIYEFSIAANGYVRGTLFVTVTQ